MLSNEGDDDDKNEEYDEDDDDESAGNGHRSEGKDADNVVILGINRVAASPPANPTSDSYKFRPSEGIELNPIHKTVIAPAGVITPAAAAAPTRGKSSRPPKDVDSDDEY